MFSFFKKKKIVPHVRLTGIIGSAGKLKQGMELANQRDILKKAFSVKKITHVAISINSPGGSPVQSHLIYSYIRQLAEKNKVKVIIFAEDVAASGGYWFACAADDIFADEYTIFGSIGVFSSGFGVHDVAIKAIINSSSNIIKLVNAMKENKKLSPKKQQMVGRSYLSSQFRAEHLKVIYDVFDDKIVDYLSSVYTKFPKPKLITF